MTWGRSVEPAWDWGLLEEIERALQVDERTIRRNVRHLIEGLGPSLLDAFR